MSVQHRRPGSQLVAAVLFCALGAAAALRLGQDANWDLQNYHLYNAWAVLQGGRFGIDGHPAAAPSFFNPSLDLLVYPLLMGVADRLGGALLGALHGGAAFLAYLLALEALGGKPRHVILAGVAALTGATSAMALSQVATSFGDLTTAVLVLGALLIIVRAPAGALRPLAAAGLLAGLATGLKLTNALYGVGLLAVLLALPASRSLRGIAVFAGTAALGVLLAYGWWGWTLYSHFGNPVFPLANSLFQSPLHPPQDPTYARFFPRSAAEWLFYPFHFATSHRTAEVPFRDFRLAAAYLGVAAIAAAWLARRMRPSMAAAWSLPNPAGKQVIVFVAASYLAWLLVFSTQRYATGMELLSGLIVVLALGIPAKPRVQLALAVAACAALVASTVVADWKRVPWDGHRHTHAWNLDPALRGAAAVLGNTPLGFLAPTTGFAETAWIGAPFTAADRERSLGLMGSRPVFLLAFPGAGHADEARRVMREMGLAIAAPCSKFSTKLAGDVLMCPAARGATLDPAAMANVTEQWRFEAAPATAEMRARPGSQLWLEMEVRNTGPAPLWANVPDTLRLAGLPAPADATGEVNLSYHVLSEQGAVLQHDGVRTPLPRSIPAGGKLRAWVRVAAPQAPGRYRIQPDLVMEGVRWAAASFSSPAVLLLVE